MSKETQLALAEQPQAIVPMQPMQMIQVAFQKALESGGPDALAVADRILEQMAKQRAYENEEAFNEALRRIQDKLKPVVKAGWNESTKSHFATADAVDDAIERLLQEERMALSFEPEPHPQPQMVRIVGVLSLGAYSRRYPLDMPADGQGAKGGGVMSRTHATGSAITYAKRYLKNMIFNLRFKEKDDDGNKAGSGELGEQEFAPLLEKIEQAPTLSEVTKAYIAAIKAAGLAGDKGAINQFENAANTRKRELQK